MCVLYSGHIGTGKKQEHSFKEQNVKELEELEELEEKIRAVDRELDRAAEWSWLARQRDRYYALKEERKRLTEHRAALRGHLAKNADLVPCDAEDMEDTGPCIPPWRWRGGGRKIPNRGGADEQAERT
jgi:hypothetical protein